MTPCDPETALQRGRSYLSGIQKSDGSFPTDLAMATTRTTKSQTIMPQALLLSILSSAPTNNDTYASMGKALAAWLIANSLGGATNVLDLTDPCLAFHSLSAVAAHNTSLIGQTMIAETLHYLVQSEVRPGGPYGDPTHKGRPDFMTNIAIARYIRQIASPLPELDSFILQTASAASNLDWPMLYYLHELFPEQYTLDVVAARAFNLTQAADSAPSAASQLLDQQQADGAWPLPATPVDKTHVLGTALALIILEQQQDTAAQTTTLHFEQLYDELILSMHNQTASASLGATTQETLQNAFKNIAKADNRFEIGPLAARFAATLPASLAIAVDPAIMRRLGLANTYTWIAYTIYDDFLDDAGKPQLLSTANIAHRRSLQSYRQALPNHTAFQKLVHAIFDGMDDSNAWEITHCRANVQHGSIELTKLPDYHNNNHFSSRTLAHVLPIMGVLAAAHISLSSQTAQAIYAAFQDYLIVRSLQDDLYDWKDDLRAGHLGYVVTNILRSAQITASSHVIEEILPPLERQFWEVVLPATCLEMKQRIDHAYALLDHNAAIVGQSVIHDLLSAQQTTLDNILHEWRAANQFLAAYTAQDHDLTDSKAAKP